MSNVRQSYVQHTENEIENVNENAKRTTKPNKNCSNCRGDGFVYAPGSGKMNPCFCTKKKEK